MCVDTSGSWGRGGMFTAVDRMKPGVVDAAYAAAKTNRDLKLGDAHLIQVAATPGNTTCVCLLACLRRTNTRRGTTMALDQSHLSTALTRLSAWAHKRSDVTVHTPRIGHRQGGSNWYAIERLMKRCLPGLHVTVYYFRRGHARAAPGPPAAKRVKVS